VRQRTTRLRHVGEQKVMTSMARYRDAVGVAALRGLSALLAACLRRPRDSAGRF